MRRSIAINSVLLAAVLVVAAGYWRFVREIAVEVAHPERNVEVRVFGIGTMEAQIVSRVGFHVAGRLVSLTVDQGDVVPAQTELARLDDETQAAKLAKSEATQRQAAANLLKAEAQRGRAQVVFEQKRSVNQRRQTLAGRGTVSQEVAEDAQAAEDIARSDLQVFEADMQVASVLRDDAAAQRQIESILLSQHRLRAPFDARIVARHKELGSVVNAGEAVFTLVAPETIWVRAFVDEALAGGLKVGQTAFVRLRSEPERVVEAELVRIDQENDRVTEERRIYVRCRVCDAAHQFRFLGEQAEVEVLKDRIAEGIFVPLRSIEGYDGRSGVIWVIENGRLAKRRVDLGQRLLDGRVQVRTALAPEAAAVIGAGAFMREGRAARPIGGP